MTPHGRKTKAGQLLSSFIRDIMEETTEFGENDDGSLRMITKAEALSRMIVKKALGYTETMEDAKGEDVEIVHQPDRTYVQIVFDRMEGRVPQSLTEGEEKMTAAEKVTEQGVGRINSVRKESARSSDDGTET